MEVKKMHTESTQFYVHTDDFSINSSQQLCNGSPRMRHKAIPALENPLMPLPVPALLTRETLSWPVTLMAKVRFDCFVLLVSDFFAQQYL